MTSETTPRRVLGGLAPRRTVEPDPTVSRLRRDHRPTTQNTQQTPSSPDPLEELSNQLDNPKTTDPQPEPEASATTDTPPKTAAQHHESRTTRAVDSPVASTDPATPAVAPDLPKYLQLVRKESRIRQDQADQLEQHARRINHARQRRHGTTGERITSNTLIRIAIDMLLQNADTLHGDTEHQLTATMLTAASTADHQPGPHRDATTAPLDRGAP